MFRFGGNSLWVFVHTFMLNLYGLIIQCISRFQRDDNSEKNDSNCSAVRSQQDEQIVSKSSMGSESDGFREQEGPQFSSCLESQKSRYSNIRVAETESSVFMESGLTTKTSRYQFVSNKDVSRFMEKPETMNFTVQEIFLGSIEGFINNGQHVDNGVSESKHFQEEQLRQCPEGSKHSYKCSDQFIDSGVSTRNDLQEFISELEVVDQEKTEGPVKSLCSEEALEEQEEVASAENKFFRDQQMDCLEKVHFFPENQALPCDSQPESESSSDGLLSSTNKVDSICDEIYSDKHDGESLEPDTRIATDERKVDFIEEFQNLEEISAAEMSISDGEAVVSSDKEDSTDEEYIELKPHLQNSSELDEESFSCKEYGKVEDLHEPESANREGMEPMLGLGKSEDHSLEKTSWFSDSDDGDESDILMEHKDLIEQMKMELKFARTGGLPTILEESETPKMVEDLKPLKIDEKFEHKDLMGQIHKFYRRYLEKMRKLDILNYQTMHAISFLQLKDPTRLTSGQKSSVSAIKSLILPNFRPYKLRRVYADPTLKSISELLRDLELVYVGQVCLSWEILHWQCIKAKELVEYDSQGHHSYSRVAGEFQQFQVLMQRFIEDEPFQGPRFQTYVKKRYIIRSLLQVPIIKDDCLKEKTGKGEEEQDELSVAMLAAMIGESMHVFWEFLRADKDEASLISNGLQGTSVDLQDPADLELLVDIRRSLQKKEKRLKDILRSGNCIVKKFQKHQGGRLDHAAFISQVELRLVSRVLSLSRLTTDQLVWCQKKLNSIMFVNRKIHVEPLFLLFPCLN